MIGFQVYPLGILNASAASGAVFAGTTPTPPENTYHTWRLRAWTHYKTFSRGDFPKLQWRAGKGFLRDQTNKRTGRFSPHEDSQKEILFLILPEITFL